MSDIREAAENTAKAIEDILSGDVFDLREECQLRDCAIKLRAALADDGWRDMKDAPRDRPFYALNHDREIWVAKYTKDGQLGFRTHGRREPEKFVSRELADGSTGMVREEGYREAHEEWCDNWTLWTRMYEFKPTHWAEIAPLPTPPEPQP